jgi:peptidoglycan-associated lipoprotein
MRNLTSFAFILSSALLFGACSSTKLDDKVAIVDKQGVEPLKSNTTTDSNTNTVASVDLTKSDQNATDPAGVPSQTSVYFDLDSYIVKDEFKPVVEANAKFLSSNKGRKIIIQGNTDERGGREYNLALGQKRAEAVRKSLAVLGVPESQMEAVSFGKEKPKALGSDEAAWAQNRRSDIVY